MPLVDANTPDGRLELLQRMLMIREFETKTSELFADNEVPGFVHLYIGEEAVAVGGCSALHADDYITSTHRGHGHCLAKGLEPEPMFAELFGKAEGYCNGKGGSMHIADVDSGMLGANGIVGAGAPIATGAALTAQLSDDEFVALSFIGDGAIAQGQVHEAMNLASVWDLPVVYLVENNQYGQASTARSQHNIDDLSETAAAYGIPGVTVDGMDVLAVYDAVKEARDRAIAGEGLSIVEAKTYRYHGHAEGFFANRPEEEVQRWRDRDPIEALKSDLVERDELRAEEFDEMRTDVQETMGRAAERASKAPNPSPSNAYEDIFDVDAPDVDYHRAMMGGG